MRIPPVFNVRVLLHVPADGSKIGLILSTVHVRTIAREFELRLPAAARESIGLLAAALLASNRPSVVDRSIAVLSVVCQALGLPEGSVDELVFPLTFGAQSVDTLRAVRDAALPQLHSAQSRWAVVWALTSALFTNGVHDATAETFAHALAAALGVPHTRVLALEDELVRELDLFGAGQAAGQGALVISDARAVIGAPDRRWALTLSALGGGVALAVGGPLSGAAFVSSLSTTSAFLLGAAASTLSAHFALEADAYLLPAEEHSGCQQGVADLRRGLHLVVYCGPSAAPGLAASPIGSRAQADSRRSGHEGQSGQSATAERESAAVRQVWLTSIGRQRWGEHRVLHWQTSHLLSNRADAIDVPSSQPQAHPRAHAQGGRQPGAHGQGVASEGSTEGTELEALLPSAQATAPSGLPLSLAPSSLPPSLLVAAWEGAGGVRTPGAAIAGAVDSSPDGVLWRQASARAEWCGAALARQVLRTSLAGSRPVTLVGASHGALVVFACLSELAACGAHGIVQAVCLCGAPISLADPRWQGARAVVLGRFINISSREDRTLLAFGTGAAAPFAMSALMRERLLRQHARAESEIAGLHGTRTLGAAGGQAIEEVEVCLGSAGHRAYGLGEQLAAFLRAAGFPSP